MGDFPFEVLFKSLNYCMVIQTEDTYKKGSVRKDPGVAETRMVSRPSYRHRLQKF